MSDELKTFIGIKMGEVSMCWNPTPAGIFDSERAVKILDEIYAKITAECPPVPPTRPEPNQPRKIPGGGL